MDRDTRRGVFGCPAVSLASQLISSLGLLRLWLACNIVLPSGLGAELEDSTLPLGCAW